MEISEEIRTPRIKQVHRENYESSCPEQYYRRSVFIPFIEHFINQLEVRFVKQKQVLSKIQNIIPKKIVKLNDLEIHETCDVILIQWPNVSEAFDTVVNQKWFYGSKSGLKWITNLVRLLKHYNCVTKQCIQMCTNFSKSVLAYQ